MGMIITTLGILSSAGHFAMAYKYEWLPGSMVPDQLIEQMSKLYSSQKGRWSLKAKRNPGAPVRLQPSRIKELLVPDAARLAYAIHDSEIVGYAIAIQATLPVYGVLSWFTELVVHEDHRQKNVGKSLLFANGTFRDLLALRLRRSNA